MPELPEVEALAGFLRESAADLVVARVEPLAVNVLKTFDPPFSALLFDLTEAVTGVLRDAERAAHGLAAGELRAEKKLGLNVHGQAGLPCPRCGDTVREVSFADRSLQYCPTCQTDGRVLADRRMSRLLK